MLAQYFDRFYVVTKFILPTIMDLKFSTLNYDNKCEYLQEKGSITLKLKSTCRPYNMLQKD